jgi:hypothetical protein
MKKTQRKKKMNKILEEITDILAKPQGALKDSIKKTVTMETVGKTYMIYSKSDAPKPMLCVHLDTINTHRPKCKIIPTRDFEYDENLGILGLTKHSPLACLGGDDRAGVWIALAIIDYMEASGDYKFDVGFFDDEEVGCNGSTEFSNDRKALGYDTTCYIGLDRKSSKGVQEVALYGDDNRELIKVFNDLGYESDMGSVTDASNLSGEVACVNLSVGYNNEHTPSEILYLHCMIDTLEKLKALELKPEPYLADYDHFYDSYSYGYKYNSNDEWYTEELEEENAILKSALEALNVDVATLLSGHKG